MSTAIYGVDFWITELYNGKDRIVLKETKSVAAKNAQDAIDKAKVLYTKPTHYIDDESGKKVNVTRKDFEPINVILRAQTD